MSGFLDRLAARAVGEAPLVHPRVRARFEPGAGALPGGGVEERAGPVGEIVEEVAAAVPKTFGPAAVARTFEPVARRLPEPSSPDPGGANLDPKAFFDPREIPPTVETPRGASPAAAPFISRKPRDAAGTSGEGDAPRGVSTVGDEERSRLRRDPHPLTPSPTRTHTRPGEGEPDQLNQPDPVSFRVVAPPLPGDVSADGRGGRGVRVHEAMQSEEPLPATESSVSSPALPTSPERRRPAASPAEPTEPPPPPLRPRSALAADLPTVEPDRHAPLPPSVEEREPSETVVHVSIGRIDVRASQPPAPERRPARPSGPRLSLADYLKRREERRR